MNSFDENGQRHEIIIVKRGHNDDHDDHHGGVWKIAFADFMTAMMCFFLVMWLINAANEETRAALASYFNPVALADRNSSPKGLQDIEGPQPIETEPEEKKQEEESSLTPSPPAKSGAAENKPRDDTARSDAQLFSDPYAVLAEIVAETGTMQNVSTKGDGGAQTSGPATGASGGESYRDPFAPDFWSRQVEGPETAVPVEDAERAKTETAAGQEAQPSENPAMEPQQPQPPVEVAENTEPAQELKTEPAPEPPAQTAQEKSPAAEAAEQLLAEAKASEPKPEPEKAQPPESPAPPEASGEPTTAQLEVAEAIRREVAQALGADPKLAEGISVSATDRGVVISITDQLNFGMFEIGSAVPRREMVLAMEKIGKILSDRSGSVIINGHTDGRPFNSPTYDNWRLSTARAHSAYYMLVRGGLKEERIVEVAGFADRKLKVTEDPLAAMNRRIEVLLELGG